MKNSKVLICKIVRTRLNIFFTNSSSCTAWYARYELVMFPLEQNPRTLKGCLTTLSEYLFLDTLSNKFNERLIIVTIVLGWDKIKIYYTGYRYWDSILHNTWNEIKCSNLIYWPKWCVNSCQRCPNISKYINTQFHAKFTHIFQDIYSVFLNEYRDFYTL